MTVEQLKAYCGATDDGRARYFALQGDRRITGWTGSVNGARGWWWAITKTCGAHEVVEAMSWASGSIADLKRDVDRKLAALESVGRELAS